MNPRSKVLAVALSGPAIVIFSFNAISLIYRREFVFSGFFPGIFVSMLLSVIPFIAAIRYFEALRSPDEFELGQGRKMRAYVAYFTACILTFLLFLWSAYAEVGPSVSGGASMSLVIVTLAVVPLSGVVWLAGWLTKALMQ